MKKTFTPGMIAWIKVLLADVCPGSGSCDRTDETESAMSPTDNYSPSVWINNRSGQPCQSFCFDIAYYSASRCRLNGSNSTRPTPGSILPSKMVAAGSSLPHQLSDAFTSSSLKSPTRML